MNGEDREMESPWHNPTTLLYRQIDRFLSLRVGGRGAEQALQGVLSSVKAIADDEYNKEIAYINVDGGNEWDLFEAVTRLLKRKNLWLQPPRALVKGEELLGAID